MVTKVQWIVGASDRGVFWDKWRPALLGSTALPHRRRKVSACQARRDRMGRCSSGVRDASDDAAVVPWDSALDIRWVGREIFFPISGLLALRLDRSPPCENASEGHLPRQL